MTLTSSNVPHPDQTPQGAKGGRRLDAALNLLDRQLVDRDGRLCGKVDDVDLEQRDDGTLVVAALLTGPGALGHRLPGLLGRMTLATWRRLHTDREPEPARIPYEQVTAIESAIRLSVGRADLPNQDLEEWARTRVIAKLPGAGHAPE